MLTETFVQLWIESLLCMQYGFSILTSAGIELLLEERFRNSVASFLVLGGGGARPPIVQSKLIFMRGRVKASERLRNPPIPITN